MTENARQLPAGDDELWSLVEAMVDGTATPAERDRLQARLHAELEARLFYVAYLDLHAQLQWRTRGEVVNQQRQRLPRPGRLVSRFRLAVAASLLLAAGLLVVLLSLRHAAEDSEPLDFPEAPPGSVAVLIDTSNTVWEKDMTLPTETGSALPPGRLKLKSGVVELAFRGGSEVLLEGPADLDVKAADRAFLHRGKLLAQVPAGAQAVRITTPGMVVTDLGGECGLLCDGLGRTEVHVFEGQVGADPTDRQGDPLPGKRTVPEKAAATVDPESRALTPMPLNEQAFASLRPEIRVADATVRAGQFADRNFSTVPRLVVKNSIADYTWDSYLRFDLSGVKGQVERATVRLVPVYVGQPILTAAAFVPDNRWGETTITWNNKPASEAPFTQWTTEAGKPVEFDVTSLVQRALAGDRKLSLRLFAPERKRGSAYVQFGSRRGDSAARPQLLVTFAP